MDTRDPACMSSRSLLNVIASLAVQIDAVDLDLISSCKRLSKILSLYIATFFLRFKDGYTLETSEMLLAFMECAIRANGDNSQTVIAECMALRERILEKIPGGDLHDQAKNVEATYVAH